MAREAIEASSAEGVKIQENARTLIIECTKRGVEMVESNELNPLNVIKAACMIWKAADELLDFDLDSERDEFEESCRTACQTTIELATLPVTDEKMN